MSTKVENVHAVKPVVATNCPCGVMAVPELDYLNDESVKRLIKCHRCGKTIGLIDFECAHGHLAGKGCTWCDEDKPELTCAGFHWIGQTLSSCENCGRPWDAHDGYLGASGGPFGAQQESVIPWDEVRAGRVPLLALYLPPLEKVSSHE